MTLPERFKELATFVGKLLRVDGFRRRLQCFYRPSPELWHVVRLVRSRWNDAHECDFWCEFGVYVPNLYRTIYPEAKEPSCPNASNMTIVWQAGWQHPPFRHKSWKLTSADILPDTDREVQTSLAYELKAHILPFLSQFEYRADVIRFLEWLRTHRDEMPGGMHLYPTDEWLPVYLAVLYWMRGDLVACQQELERAAMIDEAGIYFQDLVAELQNRLLGDT